MPTLNLREDIPGVAELWPRGQAPYLFPIDPAKYYALRKDSPIKANYESLTKLKKRLPPRDFDAVQQSLGFLLRYGNCLFPGFHFIFGEFANAEWLALVDYHKSFHRDHIVHAAQEALVVRKLLNDMKFSCESHPLAK